VIFQDDYYRNSMVAVEDWNPKGQYTAKLWLDLIHRE